MKSDLKELYKELAKLEPHSSIKVREN